MEDVGQASLVLLEVVHEGVGVALEDLVKGIGCGPVGEVKGGRAHALATPTATAHAALAGASFTAWETGATAFASASKAAAGACPAAAATAATAALKAHVGEIETAALGEVRHHGAERIAFARRGEVAEGTSHFDVRVERIEHGRLPVLGVVDEEGKLEARLEGQEFGQFQIGLQIIGRGGELVALHRIHFERAKSHRRVSRAQGHLAEVGKRGGTAGEGRHAAPVVEVRHAELVDPDFGTFVQTVIRAGRAALFGVSDPQHHGANVAQIRHAHNANHPLPVHLLKGHPTGNGGIVTHGRIALQLQRRPGFKGQINFILQRPNHAGIRAAVGRDLQGHLILVVVLAVIVAHSNEEVDIPIVQRLRGIPCLRVGKETQTLVHAHVDGRILEDRARISVAQPTGLHGQ